MLALAYMWDINIKLLAWTGTYDLAGGWSLSTVVCDLRTGAGLSVGISFYALALLLSFMYHKLAKGYVVVCSVN